MTPSMRLEDPDTRTEDVELNSIPRDHNFDLNVIPSDILLQQMEDAGFTIQYFSTRRRPITKGSDNYERMSALKRFLYNLIMQLPFYPFTHLGSTIIVMGSKE